MRQDSANSLDQSEISKSEIPFGFATRDTEIGLLCFLAYQRDATPKIQSEYEFLHQENRVEEAKKGK